MRLRLLLTVGRVFVGRVFVGARLVPARVASILRGQELALPLQLTSYFRVSTCVVGLAISFWWLPVTTGDAHKFHASFTDIAYNPDARAAEIVIRTFYDDLENVLSKRAGRDVRLDNSKETNALLFAYVQETVRLKRANGRPVKFAWVGIESQVDMVRIYVEAKMPGGLQGAQISNLLLCDLFEDQVNAVNLREQGKQAALVFKPGDQFQKVEAK